MHRANGCAWAVVALTLGTFLPGCVEERKAALLRNDDSLAADLAAAEPAPTGQVRMQRPEPPAFPGPGPVGPALAGPPAGPSGTQQTSLRGPGSPKRVKVRAYVNGRPIFDDEILNAMPGAVSTDRLAEIYNKVLDKIIEQEVLYQEAVHKLEKNNPKGLEKLKEIAQQEFESQVRKITASGKVQPAELRDLLPSLKRQMERSFVAVEYARSRIFPYVNSRIGQQEVREYYQTHLNEFQKVDTVEWQDVFIAVGPKHPTVAEARRFAEELLAQVRSPEDFARLAAFDDGDSKFRNGLGFGKRRGEIRPPELEDHLFRLQEGQIGPVVEFPTGVHIFRVLKREYAGQIPLTPEVQTQIKNKLRGELWEREYKRVVRELRMRAIIEIEREG